MQRKTSVKVVGDLLVGFLCYAFVLGLIFYFLKNKTHLEYALVLFWTFLWLLFYTQHVANIAVERYKERMKIEMMPTSEDINKEVDLLLTK